MLGYARERRGYRIYDIKNQKVIEERSVKFNESLRGSNYLGEVENETWDTDSFFEVSPERNEINQNTDNDNSIPLQTTSSPQTSRIKLPFLENIGSDHLPNLVKIDLKVNRIGVKDLPWNFKKADWSLKISLTILHRKSLFWTTRKMNDPLSSTPFFQLLILQSLDGKADSPLFNVDFTLPELTYALQNLDTNKSPGPDSIHGQFFSHLGILGRERLLYICNLSWKTGKLPRQWKLAIVIPIHKPNKNASLTTSYRPISLTSITWKLMESMVLRRLTHHLHTNNLMPLEQYAFRKGLRFESNSFLIIYGVEKYVNPSQIGLFADDVVLWCNDANISKMEFQLNRSLVNIQEFAENHKITSNVSKSTVNLFTTNSSELFLMSERLKYSKYPTYLGFTLDP
ncbi:putative RNA-directed DNA polymerase from transposon BS [Trichonephila clavipes]|nr:putative RNA-directed DNA polymerase from transposon BS [Trichonephila clavipes]